VLTGIGMVTPLGNTREETWEGVVGGRSGGATITNFPLRDAPVRFACEVKDFDPTVAMDRKLARRTDRYCQFVLVAAREAVEDSGLDVAADGLGERTGTAVATGIGGLQTLDLAHEHLFAKGIDRMSPLWITMLIPNMGAAMVSMEYGFRGPSSTVTTACAASSMAIGDAVGIIRDGRADVMVAGGSEAPITPIGVGGFYAMRAISQRNDDPETASRPFDAGRDGFVIGEGSTIVVIEELEHARARGRTHLRRDHGLRLHRGRASLHGARPDRRQSGPCHTARAGGSRHAAQCDRLHQRPRHLDSRRRRRRDARDQDGARGGARLRGAGLLHEVDDGPHARRRGLDGARDHGARALPRLSPADDQPVRARSRVRPRLRSEHRAHRDRRPCGALERVRVRRAQRVADHRALGRQRRPPRT
jgi:hypothetical protein